LAARPGLGSTAAVVARAGRNPGVEMSVPRLELWGRVVVGVEVVGPVEVRIGMGGCRSGMSRRRTWWCCGYVICSAALVSDVFECFGVRCIRMVSMRKRCVYIPSAVLSRANVALVSVIGCALLQVIGERVSYAAWCRALVFGIA
jgi:hypothetical protein